MYNASSYEEYIEKRSSILQKIDNVFMKKQLEKAETESARNTISKYDDLIEKSFDKKEVKTIKYAVFDLFKSAEIYMQKKRF